MRYAGVAIGTTALSAIILIVFFKMGFTDEFFPKLTELVLCSLLAIGLSKTVLSRRAGGRKSLLSFREMVITLSIVFATLSANVSTQALQLKFFGSAYTTPSANTELKSGPESTDVDTTPPSIPVQMSKLLLAVSAEEVSARWIALGALLMAMSPGWALVLSSLLFASLHTVIPIFGGAPEVGLLSLAPTFAIGMGCGLAFLRSGLLGAVLVHYLVNLVELFSENHTYIADAVIFGSAAVALIVLPLTLWFTRKREATA